MCWPRGGHVGTSLFVVGEFKLSMLAQEQGLLTMDKGDSVRNSILEPNFQQFDQCFGVWDFTCHFGFRMTKKDFHILQ